MSLLFQFLFLLLTLPFGMASLFFSSEGKGFPSFLFAIFDVLFYIHPSKRIKCKSLFVKLLLLLIATFFFKALDFAFFPSKLKGLAPTLFALLSIIIYIFLT